MLKLGCRWAFPVNEKLTLDLHDELYDWIWDFSRYAQQLMTKVPNKYGGFTVHFNI